MSKIVTYNLFDEEFINLLYPPREADTTSAVESLADSEERFDKFPLTEEQRNRALDRLKFISETVSDTLFLVGEMLYLKNSLKGIASNRYFGITKVVVRGCPGECDLEYTLEE